MLVRHALVVAFTITLGALGTRSAPAAEPTAKSPLMALDPAMMPAGERYPWQPKELVAIIGSHNFRHWGAVNAVAYSPDGATIASGGWDGCVRLWDEFGHETAALKMPTQMTNAMAFSSNGRVLAAGSEEGAIYAWKLGAGVPEALPPLKPIPSKTVKFNESGRPAVDALAFSADGRHLAASFGRQSKVRLVLWDTKSWPPRELPALADATAPFAFTADGKSLVTQQGLGGIAAWNLAGETAERKAASGAEIARGQMLTLAVAPDGKTAATCYGDAAAGRVVLNGKERGDVALWDLSADPLKPKAQFGAFKNDPMFYMTKAAAFSPKGDLFAFASEQRQIELWNVAVTPPKRMVALPGNVSQAGTCAFSANGTKLASAGLGVMEWNVAEAKLTLPAMAASPTLITVLNPQGTKVAVASSPASAAAGSFGQLWNLDAPPLFSSTPLPALPLLFAADGTLVAAEFTGTGGAIRPAGLKRFDISGPSPRDLGDLKDVPLESLGGSDLGIESRQAMVAPRPLPDRKTIELHRFEASGRMSTCKLKASADTGFHNNAYSATGHIVAAITGEGERRVAKVWDISGTEGKELATIEGEPVIPQVPVNVVVRFNEGTPDVKQGDNPNEARGVVGAVAERRPFRLWALALSATGDTVAIADLDGAIQVWKIGGEKPVLKISLAGHVQDQVMGAVQRMSFSPDGQELLSIGSDRKLVVWNLATGAPRYSATFPAVLTSARHFPDGRHLLTLNPDGTLYVLRMPAN